MTTWLNASKRSRGNCQVARELGSRGVSFDFGRTMAKAIVFSIIVLLQVMAVRSEMLKCDVVESTRSAVNLKQCSTRKLNYGKEYGLAFSCDFVKKRDDTVLRVVWNGDLRLRNTGPKGSSYRRWFFTINGKECKDPRTIDIQLHVQARNTNIHRPAYVEGYCRGIAAGDVKVGWNVGDAVDVSQSSYNVGDSSTGWAASVRIIVEEVDVEDANTAIV
ncbi:hypothetical protein LSAT2_023250 [Lamellibrachia satsuma]|nr:hypothetical protein LSAT2_023250 [Lamellibrachia satsuma]